MARRPFFSGDYGSSLAQIDTRPIMQGAAAQAAMYQGIGQNIAGAIEKYQLNKQKREQSEAAATGTIQSMMQNNPQALQSLSQDPKFAKAMERIQTDQASPKDFSLINSASAAYRVQQNAALEQENARAKIAAQKSQTVITDLQGQLAGLTQDEDARKVRLGNAATELAMEQVQAEMDLDKAKDEREKEEAKVRLKHLSEQVRGLKLAGDFTDLTWEERVSEVRSKAQLAKEEVNYKKATTAYTEANKRLKVAEAETAERAAKDEAWRLGDTRKIEGKTYVKTGPGSIKPIFDGLLTQADRDKIAEDAFGGERLLTYYTNTRDDKGTPNPDLFTSQEFDPNMERLLILANMGTLDDLKKISEGGPELESKVRELLGDYAPPDRVALARQALQDPNATPQVKERAKRILQMAGQ